MFNIVDEFGKNAGAVWTILNTQGPLSETKLLENTKLQDEELQVAIGWLARENKICKYGSLYKVGETNLSTKIGNDAGKIFKILETRGKVDINNITDIAQINEKDVYSAIGWLARENKIEPKPSIPREYQIKKY